MLKLTILIDTKNIIGAKEQIAERLADIGDINVVAVEEVQPQQMRMGGI